MSMRNKGINTSERINCRIIRNYKSLRMTVRILRMNREFNWKMSRMKSRDN